MLVRCSDHVPSEGYNTNHKANPAGDPTAAICGRDKCERPGKVFLNDEEWALHTKGKTVFALNNAIVKIRVEKYVPKNSN